MNTHYIRVGTQYFKKVESPLLSGDTYKTLVPWNKGEIITDHGKDILEKIPKYDGFCTIPSHIHYREEISNFRNRYEPIMLDPSPGDFPLTEKFLLHIFGDQYELGLDYLQILWLYPVQKLPVLCLVSEERNTGKTTFLNWLKLIFQGNMTLNSNEDFRSRFNHDWVSKLLVAVDEVMLDKKEDAEKIKNISTAKTYKSEAKGKDRVEIEFFAKLILCSNNVRDFIYITQEETRYWVREIPRLTAGQDNPNLLADLEEEIAAFVHFLQHRQLSTRRTSRMWFAKELVHTEALEALKRNNRSTLEQEIETILQEDFDKFDKEELKYSAGDLVEKLSRTNVRVSASQVARTIKKVYNLEAHNSSYPKYHLAMSPGTSSTFVELTTVKGRHYTFDKNCLKT